MFEGLQSFWTNGEGLRPSIGGVFFCPHIFGLSAQTYVEGLGCPIEDALRVVDDFGSIVDTHSYHHTHAYIYTMFSEE